MCPAAIAGSQLKPTAPTKVKVPQSTGKRPRLTLRLSLAPAIFILVLNIFGIRYYMLPLNERIREPMHAWLGPSGYVGQSAGILAFALFLFLWLYPLRKRFRFLSFTGPVPRWLDVHIAAGFLIPLLGATHAGWRFTGIIGLGYGAMFLVCCSGVVGRYLYCKIPRTLGGIELTMDEIARERDMLLSQIAAETGTDIRKMMDRLSPKVPEYENLGLITTMKQLLRDDWERRRAVRSFMKEWRASVEGGRVIGPKSVKRVLYLANLQIAHAQQTRALESTHRVFAFWHVAHRPIAVTALIAVTLHVAVVVLMRATWFW